MVSLQIYRLRDLRSNSAERDDVYERASSFFTAINDWGTIRRNCCSALRGRRSSRTGLELEVCFGSGDQMKVSLLFDSQEHLDNLGGDENGSR